MRALKQGVQRCPEFVGIMAAVAFVALLRTLGPRIDPYWATQSRQGAEQWNEIQAEWPLLHCADTLLALQSILRSVVLFVALCKSAKQHVALLSIEFVWFVALAIVARFVAFPLAGAKDYMLVGPAGGALPLCFDAITLTLLLCMRLHNKKPTRWVLVVSGLVLAIALALPNNLKVSDDRLSNVAFACAHLLEFLAALMHLSSIRCTQKVPGASLVACHWVVQQALAAYFFMHVFPIGTINVEEEGHGLMLVSGGSVSQLGILILTAGLHILITAIHRTPVVTSPITKPQRRQQKRSPVAVDIPPLKLISKSSTSDSLSSASTTASDSPRNSSSDESERLTFEEPVQVEACPGVPQYCEAHACVCSGSRCMYVGEEIMEVCCSEGCWFMTHGRCFRASNRATRQRCVKPGCQGKVSRFWIVDAESEVPLGSNKGCKK